MTHTERIRKVLDDHGVTRDDIARNCRANSYNGLVSEVDLSITNFRAGVVAAMLELVAKKAKGTE